MRIRLDVFECQLDTTVLTEGHIDDALDVRHVLVAKGCLQLDSPFTRRLRSRDVDDTTDCVTTKQRALRAAQHFDGFDIKHVEYRARVTGHEDAVYSDTYRWLQ